MSTSVAKRRCAYCPLQKVQPSCAWASFPVIQFPVQASHGPLFFLRVGVWGTSTNPDLLATAVSVSDKPFFFFSSLTQASCAFHQYLWQVRLLACRKCKVLDPSPFSTISSGRRSTFHRSGLKELTFILSIGGTKWLLLIGMEFLFKQWLGYRFLPFFGVYPLSSLSSSSASSWLERKEHGAMCMVWFHGSSLKVVGFIHLHELIQT